MILYTFVSASLFQPTFVPASVWLDGKPYKVTQTQVGPNKIILQGEKPPITLEYSSNGKGQTISVLPAKAVAISFRVPGAVPVRIGKNRTSFTSALQSRTPFGCNALRVGQSVYQLSGADLKFGDGWIRAEFTVRRSKLMIESVPSESSLLQLGLRGSWGGLLTKVQLRLIELANNEPTAQPGLSSAELTGERRRTADRLAQMLGVAATTVEGGTPSRPHVRGVDANWNDGVPDLFSFHFGADTQPISAILACNFSRTPVFRTIDLRDVGLSSDQVYTLWDVDFGRYLPAVSGKLLLRIEPEGTRLLLARRSSSYPDIVGTAGAGESVRRHVAEFAPASKTLSGVSELRAGERETLYISVEAGGFAYSNPVIKVDGRVAAGEIARGVLALDLNGNARGRVSWSVRFNSRSEGSPPTREQVHLQFSPAGVVGISRVGVAPDVAGYYLNRNDELMGFMADSGYGDDGLTFNASYSFTATPISRAGVPGESHQFVGRVPAAADILLGRLNRASHTPLGLGPVLDRSGLGDDQGIFVRGEPMRGLGVVTGSETAYALRRGYSRFAGRVAVEDRFAGEATFEIVVDGETRWRSPRLRAGETASFSTSVEGGLSLTLKAFGDPGPVAWINPRLEALPRP